MRNFEGHLDTVTLRRALGARPPSLVESEVSPKMEIFPGVNHMAKARIWVDKRVWCFPLGGQEMELE